MKQDSMIRPVMRRADAGVDTLAVNNGTTTISGPVVVQSPMASLVLPNIIRIDNGLTNTFAGATLTSGGITQAAIDTDVNNSFEFGTGAGPGPFVIPPPKIPTAFQATFAAGRPYTRGRKISFTLVIQAAGLTITWNGGVDGYQFANPARPGALGPMLSDFNALLAGAQVNDIIKIGFEYYAVAAANPRWVCCALAGPFSGA